MNGELALLVALAAHGAEWMRRGDGSAPDLGDSNSTLKYVSSLQFRGGKGTGGLRTWKATGSAEWFERLAAAGAETIEIDLARPVSGASAWAVRTVGGKRETLWRAEWHVEPGSQGQAAPWRVVVEGQRAPARQAPAVGVVPVRAALMSAIRDARSFALAHAPEPWVEVFDKALGGPTEIPYHPDLVPTDWDPEARALVAAAVQAWVFGGMGSWNDLRFDGRVGHQYRDVSQRLYAAVCDAVVAAVNSAGEGAHNVPG